MTSGVRGHEPNCRSRRIPSFELDSFEQDVSLELDAITRAGCGQVVVIDLTRPELAIPVVRVVVPGLHDRGPWRTAARGGGAMSVVIFAGASISAADVQGILGAECMPPAAQGDVYRAALWRPVAIGIIDGYFERVPAVWHKEILWAMSAGHPGLRQRQHGRAARRRARAVRHDWASAPSSRPIATASSKTTTRWRWRTGPPDTGYRAGSEAMVNIRATLARAVSTGVVDDPTASTLGASWQGALLRRALVRPHSRTGPRGRDCGSRPRRLRSLAWIGCGQSEARRRRGDAPGDARMLESGRPPAPVAFVFEETLWWHQRKTSAAETGLSPDDSAVLEALAQDRAAWDGAVAGALGWQLAQQDAERDGRLSEAVTLVEQASALCRRHGLPDAAAVDRWLAENRYTRRELEHLMDTSAHAASNLQRAGDTLTPILLQYLRWTGDYGRLVGGQDRAGDNDSAVTPTTTQSG